MDCSQKIYINMEKEFIPYEQALALKELGFDESCICVYNSYHQLKGTIIGSIEGDYIKKDKWDDRLSAPTFSQAFRFFREKYGYLVSPFQNENNLFFFEIGKLNTLKTEHYSKDWETYEDAEISCLVKLIEIVKNESK